MTIKLKNPFSLLGRKVSMRFDNYSWIKMCDLLGVDFDGMEKLQQAQLIPVWMYGAYLSDRAYKAGTRRWMGRAKSYKYIERIYKWYYVNDVKTLEQLQVAMMETRVMGKPLKEHAGEKKK